MRTEGLQVFAQLAALLLSGAGCGGDAGMTGDEDPNAQCDSMAQLHQLSGGTDYVVTEARVIGDDLCGVRPERLLGRSSTILKSSTTSVDTFVTVPKQPTGSEPWFGLQGTIRCNAGDLSSYSMQTQDGCSFWQVEAASAQLLGDDELYLEINRSQTQRLGCASPATSCVTNFAVHLKRTPPPNP